MTESYEQLVDECVAPLHFKGDCAVPFILHPSCKFQRLGKVFCSIPEPHSLYSSMKYNMFSHF